LTCGHAAHRSSSCILTGSLKPECLATLGRSLLTIQCYPGEAFLSGFEQALTDLVKDGKRVAWSAMALAMFQQQPSAGFMRALEVSAEVN
jgi:hypothetical protein